MYFHACTKTQRETEKYTSTWEDSWHDGEWDYIWVSHCHGLKAYFHKVYTAVKEETSFVKGNDSTRCQLYLKPQSVIKHSLGKEY